MALGIGLVGIGHVAEAQIVAMSRHERVALVAAYDHDERKRDRLPEDARYFSTLDALTECADVDVVLVSVPNRSHYEIAKAVIEQGKACVVEKPVSEQAVEFDNLVGYARRRGVFLAVALHARHALDVLWWRDHAADFDPGPITAFESGFFDPYIEAGVMQEKARGLGGAWRDSGINALSVIGAFVSLPRLRLIDARMTYLPRLSCSEVQGNALFRFPVGRRDTGTGLIDTNWTLGRNHKSTRLIYGQSGYEVVLDHSAECVTVLASGRTIFVKELGTDVPRLAAHYLGVFTELARHFEAGTSNLEYAEQIHKIYYFVIEYGK